MERILIVLLSFAVGACDRPADPSEPASTGAQPAPSAEGPESIVLLISIDTLRADHLGCYGYTRNTSPVLDGLARRGVVFEDASSTAPWTLPAHATMLTGLSPLRLGWDPLSPTTPTLGSMLAANGFETAAVVNSTYLKRDTWALTRDFGRYLYVEESPSRRSPSSWVTDRAISWLDESAAPRVFLFMHYFDVHSDYASLPRHERRFTSDYAGPATGETWQLTLSDLSPDFVSACRLDFEPRCRLSPDLVIDDSTPSIEFDARDVEHLVDLYDAGIRQMDEELGRLFSHLADRGLLDRTLLVVTSDHGEEFMEHGRLEHARTMFQEVLRVPLLISGPGIPEGRRVREPVSLLDIVPTLLGQQGIIPPPSLEGLDLAPLWSLPAAATAFEERVLFGEAPGAVGPVAEKLRYRSVRRGRYKLHHEAVRGRYTLFDLESDPREQNDILGREPDIGAELREAMRERFQGQEHARPERSLDAEDSDRLRALGYVP